MASLESHFGDVLEVTGLQQYSENKHFTKDAETDFVYKAVLKYESTADNPVL